MMNRSHGRYATRLALAGAIVGFVALASTGAAEAATLPDPLGSLATAPSAGAEPVGGLVTAATDTTVGTVDQLLGAGEPSSPSAGLPDGLPSGPSLDLPGDLPGGLPALPALPPLPGQAPAGAQDGSGGSGATADAEAPSGDNRAAVDAAVADYLGVCARVPQGVAPVQADIVVLDRNLITELVDAGVPLQQLVVPCPKALVASPAAPAAHGGDVTGAGPSVAPAPASALPTSLAFTGIDLAPTLLSALGLVALGAAFLRKARLLADVADAATRSS